MIESCDIDQSENGGNMCEADPSAQPRNPCQTSDIQKEDSVNRDETTEQATESEDQTPPGTLIIESTSKKCTTDLPCDMSQTSNRNSVELKVN